MMKDYDIRYYPVIDFDTKGLRKEPMIPSDNEESVKEHHSLWLMEISSHCFRLCSTEDGLARLNGDYAISCPSCGKALRMIGNAAARHRHGLYVCDVCRK